MQILTVSGTRFGASGLQSQVSSTGISRENVSVRGGTPITSDMVASRGWSSPCRHTDTSSRSMVGTTSAGRSRATPRMARVGGVAPATGAMDSALTYNTGTASSHTVCQRPPAFVYQGKPCLPCGCSGSLPGSTTRTTRLLGPSRRASVTSRRKGV